ncbi:MAG: polysaccharide pyruvyl transferase family protein [Nitrospirae bacterium]|nr:polysaccharide pyruvyl transferase family protein [Nitrospirota bacterium]
MSYKVCLMGASFETGNRGVSALAASFIKNVISIKNDAEILFFMGNKAPKHFEIVLPGGKVKARIVNHRLSPNAKIQEHLFWIFFLAVVQRLIPFIFISDRLVRSNEFLSALKDADFVGNIHGGDSFSDIYGVRRFIITSLDDIIALLMRKKLVLLPQTYGPYSHYLSRWIASIIIKHSYRLYTRDVQSIGVVKELLGTNNGKNSLAFCPDIAFTLDSTEMDMSRVEPPIIRGKDAPLVGLNVNGLMYNGGYSKQNMFGLKCDYKLFLADLVKRFMEETKAHILLIPHTFGPAGNINSDPDASRDLMEHFNRIYQGRIHISTGEYGQSEIKGIIGLCDFFIGSRMHACIAGLSQEIPTVGMAYSLKFQGIFDTVGVGEMVVDGRALETEQAVDRVIWCYQNREQMKTKLRKELTDAKNKVIATFKEILSNGESR